MLRKKISFPKRIKSIPQEIINKSVLSALEEDLGVEGDITSLSTLSGNNKKVQSKAVARENGVICGAAVFRSVYKVLDPSLKVKILKKDGETVKKGDKIIEITGNAASITTGERTAMNFLGLMSGISTKVRHLVSSLKNYPVKLLDTRKTLPGLRYFQKYAVAVGGGYNHRIGLFDMILIKENHIAAAGGITPAVKKARDSYPGSIIEIEIQNLKEAEEVLYTEADIVMLDNMDDATVKKALIILKKDKYIEVSGNIDEARLLKLAGLGVDFISMGSLTHTVKPLDLSLLIL